MDERHTQTGYFRANVTAQATLVLEPVNRLRVLHLDVELTAPPMFVGENGHVTPLTGRVINALTGSHYRLGPDKPLYAVIVGPGDAALHVTEEDSIDAGQFTDAGSGVEEPERGRGDAEKKPPPAPRPGSERAPRE